MTNLEPLTQATFKETWTVQVGREKFTLNGQEMAVVLQEIRRGNRGIIQLKDRGFSIAHLESYWLESREKNQLKLDRPEAVVNEGEKENAEKKLNEIRSRYKFLDRRSIGR